MKSEALVDVTGLAAGLRRGEFLVVDCRHDLSNPESGRQAYFSGHIPGAHHAHLDDDLAAPATPTSGRHPLPPPGAFAAFLSRIGWHPGLLLVACDERSNAMAARLWWLMRYFGKPAALLDGGLDAWRSAGLPLESGLPQVEPTIPPELEPNPGLTVSAGEILSAGPELTLIDARSAERYRGEVEPIDPRAGHIPGALNRPMGQNLDDSGRFKSAARLREEFAALLGNSDPSRVVSYCGSGVTACHNLFALERAGLEGARVYPGSWSEWVRDPGRPVASG